MFFLKFCKRVLKHTFLQLLTMSVTRKYTDKLSKLVAIIMLNKMCVTVNNDMNKLFIT